MVKTKKAPIAILGTEDDQTVEQLAKELYEITNGWRPSHLLNGQALVYVRDTVARINQLLNPEEKSEEEPIAE